MTDIEVKRKELETAKRIRDNGYSCHSVIPYISCYNAPCPSNGEEKGCLFRTPKDWDAFISTREAELAEMEKAAEDIKAGDPVAQTLKGYVKTGEDKTATGTSETFHSKTRLCFCGGRIKYVRDGELELLESDRIPTLDDFALALIQGGYYESGNTDNLIEHAGKIKAALDARREA